MNDQRTGRLFGIDLPVFSESTSDARGIEQTEEFLLITHLGTGRVSEGIAAASIVLGEELANPWGIVPSDSKFRPHALVPEFGESLGRFDTESVEEEVLLIFVVFEE